MQPRLDAILLQPLLDARQVALHNRPDVVIHDRRDGAIVLAELRQDVRGERDGNVGKALGNDVA